MKGFAAMGLLGILVAMMIVAYLAMTQFGEQLDAKKGTPSSMPAPAGMVSQDDLLKDPTLDMNRKAAEQARKSEEMKCTIDSTSENCTKK